MSNEMIEFAKWITSIDSQWMMVPWRKIGEEQSYERPKTEEVIKAYETYIWWAEALDRPSVGHAPERLKRRTP